MQAPERHHSCPLLVGIGPIPRLEGERLRARRTQASQRSQRAPPHVFRVVADEFQEDRLDSRKWPGTTELLGELPSRIGFSLADRGASELDEDLGMSATKFACEVLDLVVSRDRIE